MHIVVVTRATPDDNARIRVAEDGSVKQGEKLVINPWDEYTVTEALALRDAHGGQVTVIAVGDEVQNEALKQSLALGCNQAIRLDDTALSPHDSLQFSQMVVAAIQKLGDVDVVLFGKEFPDHYTDQHIYRIGRKLGWEVVASMLSIEALDLETNSVTVKRMLEQGVQTATTTLPTVISLFDDINEPKYPSFMNIRKAAKAQIPVWDGAELGIKLASPTIEVIEFFSLPERTGAIEMIAGETAAEKAESLVNRLMEEKVL